MTTRDVADFFLVAYMTVYRLIDRKELEAFKVDGKNWYILRSDLTKYCSKNCNL